MLPNEGGLLCMASCKAFTRFYCFQHGVELRDCLIRAFRSYVAVTDS